MRRPSGRKQTAEYAPVACAWSVARRPEARFQRSSVCSFATPFHALTASVRLSGEKADHVMKIGAPVTPDVSGGAGGARLQIFAVPSRLLDARPRPPGR